MSDYAAPFERSAIRRWREESLAVDTAYRTISNWQGAVGMAVLLALVIVALFADVIAGYGEAEQVRGSHLVGPSWQHLFGTDNLSRDVFSRVLFGLRISLWVSAAAVLGGGSLGTLFGFFAGYAGGWTETILMRFVDTLLAFPILLLGIAILAILGTGTQQVALALGIAQVPYFARLARAQMLAEKERDYVLAAQSLGAPPAPDHFPPHRNKHASPIAGTRSLGNGIRGHHRSDAQLSRTRSLSTYPNVGNCVVRGPPLADLRHLVVGRVPDDSLWRYWYSP